MRSLAAAWLLLLLSLTIAPAAARASDAAPQDAPISAEAYWEFVAESRQVVLELDGQPEPEVRRGLNALAARWERVTAVQRSDGSLIPVDPNYLSAALRGEPPEPARLASLFEALLRAHQEYPQAVFTAEDVAPLQGILARPEFQWQKARPLEMPGWLVRLLQWLDRLTNRVVGATLPYGRLPLILGAVLFFLVSLFFIWRGLSRSLVREAALAEDAADGGDALSSKGAFKRAETLSQQGDYRNAIRYLYLSSLLVLDEQGLMRYDRSRTNREYLRSMASHPALAKPLRDVIDVFDRVWYGFETVDETTYRSYVQHVEELREKKE